uniref:BAH domain-containing protein n=1 Tax=Panagrolaimus davidi TaxID=227884 RepID=A0A914QXA7_9BILA
MVAMKDENNNASPLTDIKDEENVSSFSCKTINALSSPFSQINGEQNRRSQRLPKEPTTTISVLPKKRKSMSKTAETPAKRRRRTKKSSETSPESANTLASEHQNWIPIGKPWAEMVSIGSSTTKKAVCCFPAVKHKTENVTFNILDVISVAAGEEETDGDNIGKIDRLFFDKKLGMCANVLWYYKYNQCMLKDENRFKVEKKYIFHDRELIASKHTDTISCDSIQSHAFVLTFSEYCRYIAENKYDRLPSKLQSQCKELWPRGESKYPRRRYLPHEDTPQDLVYFCRKYYSIARKEICSTAPSQTPAQKRKIMKGRPINRLMPVPFEDSVETENLNKTPE